MFKHSNLLAYWCDPWPISASHSTGVESAETTRVGGVGSGRLSQVTGSADEFQTRVVQR